MFGRAGLNRLGFRSFAEAYNVVGYALGGRPSSIKNYRDEFDPLFPNERKGWHKRALREHCKVVLERYRAYGIDELAALIKSFAGFDESIWSGVVPKGEPERPDSEAFARRLITGLAAERYFEAAYPAIREFNGFQLENTTHFGCNYDFKLTRDDTKNFLAVEVKGIRESVGSKLLTPKEYEAAVKPGDRFYLFVVKNFQKNPFHEMYVDPTRHGLQFTRNERTLLQISWLARV